MLVLKAIARVLHAYLPGKLMNTDVYTLRARNREEALAQILEDIRNYIVDKPNAYVVISQLHSACAKDEHKIQLRKRLNGMLPPEEGLFSLLDGYLSYGFKGTAFPLYDPLEAIRSTLLLMDLDDVLRMQGCFYARFSHDWVLVVPKRNDLNPVRRAQKKSLKELGFNNCAHTLFVGKASWGFGFPGQFWQPSTRKLLGLGYLYALCVQSYEAIAGSNWRILANILFVLLLVGGGIFAGQFLMETLDGAINLGDRLDNLMLRVRR